MNILAFVDLHEQEKEYLALKKKASSADVIVCPGDFTIFEHGLMKWAKKLDALGKPMLLLPGNHEDVVSIKQVCAKSKNLFALHSKAKYIGNVMFVGFGEGGFSSRDERFDRISKKIEVSVAKRRKLHPELKIVFLTHGPPYGNKLDDLDGHVGCRSYTSFIKKVKPDFAISGHIHENAGKEDKIGVTKLLNPGPSGKIIKI